MTIFVTWQLIVILDSIRNSCNVFYDSIFSKSKKRYWFLFFSEWVSNFWKQQLKGTEVSVVRSRLFCIYCILSCENKKEAFWTMYLQSGWVFVFKIIDFANMHISFSPKKTLQICIYPSLQKRENDNFIDNHHQVGRVGMVVLATDHTLEMVAAFILCARGVK